MPFVRRELSSSFLRGARLGAVFALPMILAVVAGAFTVLSLQPSDPPTATLMPSRIDRALTLAIAPERRDIQQFFTLSRDEGPLFEDIEPDPGAESDAESDIAPDVAGAFAGPESTASAPPPADVPPAPPVTTPAPTPTQVATPVSTPVATPPPAVVIPSGRLYEIVAETFPEDPEFAYSVVMCESSGNASINTGNGYYGMWQFDLPTWQSVGGTGLPSNASIDEQMLRARMLYDARGWQPWGCAR